MADTASSMHMETVGLDLLQGHPDNDYPVREEELADLMESIRRDGLAQLPLVRPLDGGGFQIIAGHRRIECFRRLAASGDDAYASVPVNVLDGCSDERALVLMDISNLMVRQLTPVERARRFERLWSTVPELRRQSPELRGVRTSQIIADMISQETGQPISRASVDRVLAAGRRAQEVSQLVDELEGSLIKGWANEFRVREGFAPEAVEEVASRTEAQQLKLLADYQRDEMSPKQLSRLISRDREKTEADMDRALDGVIHALDTVAAWKSKYGLEPNAHRLRHIKGQIKRLGQ